VIFSDFDAAAMRRALELARRGEGRVEPNPMVGAVVADPATGLVVAEGWHAAFGEPHAEAAALGAAGARARGATLYVTLEPCCHHGKTPPCTAAIVAAEIARVVVAAGDPFPEVRGRGLDALRSAGIRVETGLMEPEARRLTAPFRKLVETGMPWVIAKWAMTRDRRLAAAPGHDRWISSAESRRLVHALRGRVDAIVVGIGTALADDPLLTARDGATRQPLRAREVPVLVVVGPDADAGRIARLAAAGCEVRRSPAATPRERLEDLLRELGARRFTNVLVEGGAGVFAELFAAGLADELWEFVAPHSCDAAAPGLVLMPEPPPADAEDVAHPGGDTFTRSLVRASSAGRGSRSASA
jgi:diaminohydroxyphosphoribosylaminopyrimidine deaminase/5-amino-6-(5-phosphoribosylamino)uracil reductase